MVTLLKTDGRKMNSKRLTLFVLLFLLVLPLTAGCSDSKKGETLTIGIVNLTPLADPVYEGFKAGMAELGYVEGEDIVYIYDGATGSVEGLDPNIQSMIEQDVDLIFALCTPTAQKARKSVEGTDIPVVFAPVNDPVQSGIVDNLRNPGCDLTGIKIGGYTSKQLEWLLIVAPDIQTVLVLHNPDTSASVLALEPLNETAATLGVEIVVRETRTPEEVLAAIESIPQEVDAIHLVADASIQAHIDKLVEASLQHEMPLSSFEYALAEAGALLSYGPEMFPVGEQSARLADQILHGISVTDLPVETAEYFLTINLRTAKAIGLDIPDEVLDQADNIIR